MRPLLTLVAITGGFIAAVHTQSPTCVATQPPPTPTATCGLRGTNTYSSWRVANPGVASSLEDCARICNGRRINAKQGQMAAQQWCRSFYWDSVNNLCGLGGESVYKSITANASSTHVFYSYRCFNCGAFCDQPYGQQLVENGGFEKYPLGPWLTNGGTGPGFNSSTSWEVTPSGFDSIRQNYNHCGGNIFKFSFDYKVTLSGEQPPIFMAYFGVWTFQDTSHTGTAGQWRSITGFQSAADVSFNAGDVTGQIRNAKNTYNVDNVFVSNFPVDTVETRPLAQPAFQNSGFESGRLSPWSLNIRSQAPYSIVSPGFGGSDYALFIDLSQKGTAFYLSQTMQTKPNTNYMLSFDYEIQGKHFGDTSAIDLDFVYGSNGVKVDVTGYESFDLHFGKHSFKYPIAIQTAETPFEFSFQTSIFWTKGNVTFDNFLVEEIIE